ncbi:MAG: hypothetical protein J1F65_03055 [Clostridiales bacterium]|nr:hypothetical protein [Clostridiales bacterium]
MACKVIVNRDSGNAYRLDLEKLLCMLGCMDAEVETVDGATDWSADGCDTVIVCGGDGTLHSAIEKCSDKRIIYAPCGTLNETSRTEKTVKTVGKVNGNLFSYVCAAGSFTEIGYTAKTRAKQIFGSVAYLPEVFKHYKSHQIHAELNVDGVTFEDEYTLLMVLKSHRCFGFRFNKSYRKHKGLYLLAIKSCGEDNLFNKAKMFFPFFRVFFCGVSKPCCNKQFMLLPFDKLTIDLQEPQDFCVDGEKQRLFGRLEFCEQRLDKEITIIKTPFCRRKKTL